MRLLDFSLQEWVGFIACIMVFIWGIDFLVKVLGTDKLNYNDNCPYCGTYCTGKTMFCNPSEKK